MAKKCLVLFSPSAIFQKSKIFTTLSTKNEKHFYELLDYLPNRDQNNGKDVNEDQNDENLIKQLSIILQNIYVNHYEPFST